MPSIKRIQSRKQDQKVIKSKLTKAGIKVHSGKKTPRNGEYSGIIGANKKILELKI